MGGGLQSHSTFLLHTRKVYFVVGVNDMCNLISLKSTVTLIFFICVKVLRNFPEISYWPRKPTPFLCTLILVVFAHILQLSYAVCCCYTFLSQHTMKRAITSS